MKQLLLAATLIGCIVACNTTDKKSVNDPAAPNAPKAECDASKGSCSDMKAEGCSGEKKSCCAGETKPQG
jgi:hypothetical protein